MAQSLDFTICEFLQQNSCHQYHAIHIDGDIIPSIFMECLLNKPSYFLSYSTKKYFNNWLLYLVTIQLHGYYTWLLCLVTIPDEWLLYLFTIPGYYTWLLCMVIMSGYYTWLVINIPGYYTWLL